MKRRDLLKQLAVLAARAEQEMTIVEGGRHTKIIIGPSQTVIPRHREINELTARAIIRQVMEQLT